MTTCTVEVLVLSDARGHRAALRVDGKIEKVTQRFPERSDAQLFADYMVSQARELASNNGEKADQCDHDWEQVNPGVMDSHRCLKCGTWK